MASLHNTPKVPSYLLRVLLLGSGVLLIALLAGGQAQVTTTLKPDGTLGTAVSRRGTVYDITGGKRPGNGPNLFHSFDRFSVGTGDTVNFTSEQTGIKHILSRVTGGQPSDIDGQLRTDGQLRAEGANLYLLNPSGVLFGPKATLDVGGSFHVSTADYLRLADGARFFARLSETSTLSVAPPTAFGFLGPQVEAITVRGSSLQVPEGQTLSVVGGDVQIVGGTLFAPSGRIQLASVAAAGEVLPVTSGPAPDLQVDSVARLGTIALSQGQLLTSGDGGGTVLIRGGRLRVDGSSISSNNLGNKDGTGLLGVDLRVTGDAVITNRSVITADRLGTGSGRDLQLTAGSVSLENASLIGSQFLVQVGQLTLTGGAQISSGRALSVTATDAITIRGRDSQGRPSGLFSNTAGRGDAGSLSVSASTLRMEDGGLLQTSSSGNAGRLEVQVGRLTLSGGAQLSTSALGEGRGGDLRVTARDEIVISGRGDLGQPSGLFSGTFGRGDAGALFVKAPTLRMEDGGLMQAGGITDRSLGSGNAGPLEVQVGRLTLSGGAQLSTRTLGPGRGGDLSVTATDAIFISGRDSQGQPSGLFSDTFGSGDAGSLFVKAPTLRMEDGGLMQAGGITDLSLGSGNAGRLEVQVGGLTLSGGAQLSTRTLGPGRGGDLSVTATDAIFISGRDSQGQPSGLFSDTSGSGAAGSLFVKAPTLRMEDGGLMRAASLTGPLSLRGSGNAGSLEVQVGGLTLSGGAQLSTRTLGPGRGGDLSVTATDAIVISGRDSQGQPSGLFSDTFGRGAAGALSVSAPTLRMEDGGLMRAASLTGDSGNAGSLEVQVGGLTLSGGAQLSSSTAGQGRGGDLSVTATDAIFISGRDSQGQPSGLFSDTSGSGAAGSLFVKAPTLRMEDGGLMRAASLTGPLSLRGSGNAGSLEVQVGGLTLSGGAQLSTRTLGPGRGGDLSVTATDAIVISGRDSQGQPSGLFSDTSGRGAAGALSVSAPTLRMEDGGLMRAASLTGDSGNAGSLEVQVGGLTLSGGAQLSSSTAGQGRGGDLRVTATDAIVISGRDSQGQPSGLFSDTSGSGAAGALSVSAPTLRMEDGGLMRAASLTGDSGNAGSLEVQVGGLTLSGGAQLSSSTAGQGQGGNLQVTAAHLQLSNGGTISASSSGTGNAGNVTILTQDFQSTNGSVTTQATQAAGGNIRITASHLVRLRDSKITAETGRGTDAGNIAITSQVVVLQNSQVTANAPVGLGGNIDIQAQVYLEDPASTVRASAPEPHIPVVNLSAVERLAPVEFAPTTELLHDPCAAQVRSGKVSSFVVRGRDGVPVAPGGLLPDPLSQEEIRGAPLSGAHKGQSHTPALSGGLLQRDNTGHIWEEPEKRFARTVWDTKCGR